MSLDSQFPFLRKAFLSLGDIEKMNSLISVKCREVGSPLVSEKHHHESGLARMERAKTVLFGSHIRNPNSQD